MLFSLLASSASLQLSSGSCSAFSYFISFTHSLCMTSLVCKLYETFLIHRLDALSAHPDAEAVSNMLPAGA